MRIVKVGVLAPTNKGIPLGVQGENQATDVEFDTRPWFREYPSGTVSAVARRDGDPAPYPLSLDVADGTAVWQVSDTDTAKAGEGAVELTMTSAGTRVRSLTFKTLVTASLTDAPVDDDAWYGWLDKAVVKVDETVQSAQRKMAEVDEEWTGLKADVTAKVEECGKVAAQAADDAHHAKVDAQATSKALESAEGSVAKAEAAANRAVDAALAADDSAVEANRSALGACESAEAAAGSATNAATYASEAATSASNAADAASAASGSASAAEQSATDASSAKVAAQTAKAEAEAAKSEAATSASNAAESAENAANSAHDAAASVGAINVIAPKSVKTAANATTSNVAVGNKAVAIKGFGCVAIGNNAIAYNESISIGDNATGASESSSNAVSVGHNSAANFTNSVALGALSKCSKVNEISLGAPANDENVEYTREITHVSTPKAPTSASTKKYTDDNDTKTLTEAKKYTDANTSNVLTGTVSGKLLHVEDAWPSKPLRLTIEGACKQDGTPSPESPAPITVIENPVLMVTGRNLVNLHDRNVPANDKTEFYIFGLVPSGTTAYISFVSSDNVDATYDDAAATGLGNGNDVAYSVEPTSIKAGINKTTITPNFDATEHLPFYGYRIPTTSFHMSNYQLEVGGYHGYRPYTSTALPITLPAEHPYLAKLPDGTCDTIEIYKYGNASLVARVIKTTDYDINHSGFYEEKVGGAEFQIYLGDKFKYGAGFAVSNVCVDGIVDKAEPVSGGIIQGGYVRMTKPETVTDIVSARKYLIDIGFVAYIALVTPVTYQLGKLDIPALPETISNVYVSGELTPNCHMTYKRDVNIVISDLTAQIAALKGTNDIVHDDSTASPDATVVLDNSMNVG